MSFVITSYSIHYTKLYEINFRLVSNVIAFYCFSLSTSIAFSAVVIPSNDVLGTVGLINYESVNKPLVDFCREINNQTSYNVRIDDKLLEIPVSLFVITSYSIHYTKLYETT